MLCANSILTALARANPNTGHLHAAHILTSKQTKPAAHTRNHLQVAIILAESAHTQLS